MLLDQGVAGDGPGVSAGSAGDRLVGGGGRSLSLDSVYGSLSPLYERSCDELQNIMSSVQDGGLSPGKMLYFQGRMFKFTTTVQLISTVSKELSDTIKAIIQKIG